MQAIKIPVLPVFDKLLRRALKSELNLNLSLGFTIRKALLIPRENFYPSVIREVQGRIELVWIGYCGAA